MSLAIERKPGTDLSMSDARLPSVKFIYRVENYVMFDAVIILEILM